MPYAGGVDTAQLDLDVYDTDTLAVLAVRHPVTKATSTPTLSHTLVGDKQRWQGLVPYPVSGLWWHTWTVTGTGAGETVLKVPVAPAGPGAWRSYATTTDLADYLGEAPP